MKEIKFRYTIKRSTGHTFKEIFSLEQIEAGEVALFFEVNHIGENSTVFREQYTGLKDQSGVDMYEGDIVEFDADEWGSNITNKHLITWNEEEASFCFGGGLNKENEYRTVIGNIHQNKELLGH